MEVHLVAILSVKSSEGTQGIINNLLSNKQAFEFPIYNSLHPALIIDSKSVDSLNMAEKKYFNRIKQLENQEAIIIASNFNLSPISEDLSISKFLTEKKFKNRIIDLILAVNLAYCGGLNVFEGQLFSNGKTVDSFGLIINELQFGKLLASNIGWPLLSNLPIGKTFSWFMKFNETLDNVSNSSISRALNAFTYLFHTSLWWEDDTGDLLKSLVGLEAIYTDDHLDLQNQLDYKSQLILGERQEFKKVIKKMYKYRSMYIHGKLNIASQFSIDKEDYFNNYYPDAIEATNTATSVLVATPHYFINNDITDINFLRTYNYEFTTSKNVK